MMNLCKVLLSKNPNLLITFVLTEEWLGFEAFEPKPSNVRFASIPNVIPSELNRANNFVTFLKSVMTKMEAPFEELLGRLQPSPTVIIADTYLFWAVRVANRRSVPVGSFFPMSMSFFAVLKHFRLLQQNGHYPVNVSEDGEKRVDYIPGNTSIRLADFPYSDASWESSKLLELALNVIPWVHKAQYLIFPSIYELEPRAMDALKEEFSIPIYTVGPAIPYFGSNSHVDSVNNNAEPDYFQWLDSQPPSSVLYVSQGSYLSVSSAQSEEIAAGLRDSGIQFLWIQRGESSRLKEICGKKGLILPWCDQLRVLQHPSIGGFWSHCGWNSTKEGVLCGVPFLTSPLVMDQPINCKYIVEDWKVGWRVRTELKQDTFIGKNEIANIVKKFMDLDTDEGKDMRKRARELQQLCQEAIGCDGSSETNMKAFLSHIVQIGKH